MKNINQWEKRLLQSTVSTSEKPALLSSEASFCIPDDFSQQILNWFDLHGRKDLPWQQGITPYRVWISEIMLQQTQVSTVIPYFNNFMSRFPVLERLATSHIDEVLNAWSGLGYYSRARHLHKTAGIVMEQHNGRFPESLKALEALPGIGRSTAGAIMSIAMDQPAPILDGNVKRVLCRYFAIAGWPGTTATQKKLWAVAEQLVPGHRHGHYTQAMMDIGAALCKRGKPLCDHCPLQPGCKVAHTGKWNEYPASKPKKPLPVRKTYMLILADRNGFCLLKKRNEKAVWQGLWSLPEATSSHELETLAKKYFNAFEISEMIWPVLRHTFSHYHLDITPIIMKASTEKERDTQTDNHRQWCWHKPDDKNTSGGLPAPVSKLLLKFHHQFTQCN